MTTTLVAILVIGGGLWFGRGLLPTEEPVSPGPAVTESGPPITTEPPPGDETCVVPVLVGLPLDTARAEAAREGFTLDEQLVEDGQASGNVISQDPGPGDEAECDSVIRVEWSGIG